MNYYPVSSIIGMESGSLGMFIVNDRAQGGSSLAAGQVELMVHRRIQQEDWRGNPEHLDEEEGGVPLQVRLRHYVSLGDTEKVRKL